MGSTFSPMTRLWMGTMSVAFLPHFETWFGLASAGQFDNQGEHHALRAFVGRGLLYRCHKPQTGGRPGDLVLQVT